MVGSLKFFLGKDPDEKESDDSGSDNEVNPRDVIMANKFNKKTRKREKQLTKVKKIAAKAHKKKSKPPAFNFSAIHLLHDPQGMAEKLFKQLETTTKRFEVKLMTLDVISRLIGLHTLFLLNFYPYLQRFIQPHQREVTRVLQFVAQACHELVPPDAIEPLLKTIANNFITERNTSDVMAIGLNAVREICARCPLAMSEDLIRDLVEYKNYRERSVMMAARSLMHLFRTVRPELLHRKDRGRPTEATEDHTIKEYAQMDAKDYIPGAEVLLKEDKEDVEIDSGPDTEDDDDEWVDIPQSDDELISATGANDTMDVKTKKELAKKVTLERILTDEDFKRIEAANIRKQIDPLKKGKRKLEDSEAGEKSELVQLGDIENIHKKRKHDKATRVESVRKGQEDREKFGYKDGRVNIHCSKTNREKKKTKNYQMIRHKVRSKIKRSFKDKQVALRNYLIKQKRMK